MTPLGRTVAAAGRLSIQPGTVIRFYSGTGLYVDGQLTADGQMADRIVFTSSADTVDGTPEAGGWNGVMFRQNAGGVLRNCDLRYGTKTVNIYKSSPTVDRCIIEDFDSVGIHINGYNSDTPITPLIENCRIGQHETNLRGTATGIYVHYLVDVVISNCAVSACNLGMDFEAYKLQAPHFQVTDCQISDHTASGIYAHAGG